MCRQQAIDRLSNVSNIEGRPSGFYILLRDALSQARWLRLDAWIFFQPEERLFMSQWMYSCSMDVSEPIHDQRTNIGDQSMASG